jgi:hypothetical protein
MANCYKGAVGFETDWSVDSNLPIIFFNDKMTDFGMTNCHEKKFLQNGIF